MKVVCFGEALVDMLSNKIADAGSSLIEGSAVESFSKFAGGAPANVAVAIAKLSGKSYFSGMLGHDMFGRFLFAELQKYQVNTDYIRFTNKAKTGLAFVSLDKEGERSFEFYRPPAADLLFTEADFSAEVFSGEGILHICSNSLTDEAIAKTTTYAVKQAKEKAWLSCFDVNLRHNLWPTGQADKKLINQLVAQVDIVKMSKEELLYLSTDNSHYIDELFAKQVKLLMVTDGGKPLHWYQAVTKGQLSPPKVNMIDSTAAGDAFIGGVLYQLWQAQVTSDTLGKWLSSPEFVQALSFASACGAHAAAKQGAFPSLPTQQSLSLFLQH